MADECREQQLPQISEYEIMRRYRLRPPRGSAVARGSGLCVLYRDQLRVQQLEVPTSCSILESLWIGLCRGQSSVLGVMYRPSRGAVQPVLDDMQNQLAQEYGSNKSVLSVGDFNFDTAQCPAEQTRCAGLHGTTGRPEHEIAREAAYQTFIGLSTGPRHRAYG